MTAERVTLREMRVEDLAVFFEHQRDSGARRMEAFTSGDPEDRDGFLAKWSRILGDDTVEKRTVLHRGEVAGLIVAFDRDGKREVSYWLGREHWGKGVASAALGAFLGVVTTRPLHALAAKDHRASARVLEKCGFRVVGERRGFAEARGEEIEEVRFELHDAEVVPRRTRSADRTARRESEAAGSPDGWTPSHRSATLALALLVPVPSIGILIALHGPVGADGAASWVAQAGWVASKLWILLLPAVWHRLVDGRRLRIPAPRSAGMFAACSSGGLFVAVIAAAFAILGDRWVDLAAARDRIAATGLDRPGLYLAMAVYWCTVNSLLEEYVWRWFVFTRCKAVLSRPLAIVVAGLFFTIHHAIALAVFFDDVRVVALASIGIWIAGGTWSWIYLRWQNLYAAYVSHVFADVVIFWIGYRILF